MENILEEKPSSNLAGRLKASVEFVDDTDVIGKTILDIGCGYGWCELNFLGRGVQKIVGVERSEKDLNTIKKNISHERLELKVASATSLPFLENSFDTIVSWEVIEHIPKGSEKLMFSEVARVLKQGGVFYLSTPHSTLFTNILDPAWLLAGHRHYTQEKLEELAREAGLKVELVSIKGGWWSLLYILNLYISKWIFQTRPIFDPIFSKKEHIEYMNEGFANIFIKLRNQHETLS